MLTAGIGNSDLPVPYLLCNMKISRKMVRMKACVFLVMFLSTVTVSRGETEVSCVFMETCILPCSFLGSTEVQIHWFQLTNRHSVHFYKNNQDQLKHQNRIYRNRTSLFKDQISRGNASLQLTGVKVQDEGLYQCFISTISESKASFVYLKVEAPVNKVNIQQVENNITCSSEGIYPQPEITWSTTPPSNINLHNTTTVQQNEQQLYSISSSLILSDNDTDLVYNCTISTPTNRRRAAWRKLSEEDFDPQSGKSVIVGGIIGGVIGAVLVSAAAVGLFLFWKMKKGQQGNNTRRTRSAETTCMNLEDINTGTQ